MRELTNIFSEKFTGTTIHSASLSHWDQAFVQSSSNGTKKGKEASLADYELGKKTKSRQERLEMRYSPLVDRYLKNHNYETINNVRMWKMLLIQRNEIQDEVDKKFKKFKKIADQTMQKHKERTREHKLFIRKMNREILKNKIETRNQLQGLKDRFDDMKENGNEGEFANMITSNFQQKMNVLEASD